MSGKKTDDDGVRHIKCELDPEIYDLVWQYRSDKGLLSLANAVSDLIKKGYQAHLQESKTR